MKELNFSDAMGRIQEKLKNGGVFLTVPGSPPNTMTIAWATMGFCWNKPVFVCLVRPQRHTYPLLAESGEFTVSVPTREPLKEQLSFAGSRSGQDYNKFSGHGITARPSLAVSAPVIGECGLHLECKVLLAQNMTGERMNPSVAKMAYPAKDFHTMFWGEVVKCYTTDE